MIQGLPCVLVVWALAASAGETPFVDEVRRVASSKHTTAEHHKALDRLIEFAPADARKALLQLREMMNANDECQRAAAAHAVWIIEKSPEAVLPTLLGVLRTPAVAHKYTQILARARASATLGEMGPVAKEAMPDLYLELFRHQHNLSPSTLAKIDEKLLHTMLLDGFGNAQSIAMKIVLLDSPYHNRRFWPGYVIEEATKSHFVALGKNAIPTLKAALGDKRDKVRLQVVRTLIEFGPAASDCTAGLRKLRDDGDVAIRVAACEALIRIADQADDVLPELGKLLVHGDIKVRKKAGELCALLKGRASPAIPTLIQSLGIDTDWGASKALAEIGAEARPALLKSLESKNSTVRLNALAGLLNFRGDVEPAVVPVSQLVKDPDAKVQAMALGVLINFGPRSLPYRHEFVSAYEEGRISLSNIAAALLAMGPDAAKDLVPVIVQGFKKPDAGPHYAYAAQAIAKLAPERAEEVTAVFVPKLSDPRDSAQAVAGIWSLGPLAKSAAPELKRLLKTGDLKLRPYILSAWIALGPEARVAETELVEVLFEVRKSESDTRYHRGLAAKALSQIALSENARMRLEAAANGLDMPLAMAAREALKRETKDVDSDKSSRAATPPPEKQKQKALPTLRRSDLHITMDKGDCLVCEQS